MSVYYNEIDPFAAAWLRELIKADQIPDGEVDERSITDVRPDDLKGFAQCHFFAGIGGWAYALRLVGWGERPVWTGSCPCQPFSSAGAQAGGHDPRDLWPVWFELVKECRPVVVFGEQVEAAIGHGWLDRLCDDLEAEGYALGACGLPAASVGAFHIRQRLWFVADAPSAERRSDAEGRHDVVNRANTGRQETAGRSELDRAVSNVADAETARPSHRRRRSIQPEFGAGSRDVSGLADPTRRDQRRHSGEPRTATDARGGEAWPSHGHAVGSASELGDTAGGGLGIDGSPSRHPRHLDESIAPFWSACDWLPCIDGKARPVEPGTFPLVAGLPKDLGRLRDPGAPFHAAEARVMRLRGYGNSIVPQVAQVFIESYLDTVGTRDNVTSGIANTTWGRI